MNIGIIGAGATGLAAAYDLSAKGHKVVVYESAPFIGGQASTIPVGGSPLERGYHHLFTNDKAILDLMDELVSVTRRHLYVREGVQDHHGPRSAPIGCASHSRSNQAGTVRSES